MRRRLAAVAVSAAALTLGTGLAAAPASAGPADNAPVRRRWTPTHAGRDNPVGTARHPHGVAGRSASACRTNPSRRSNIRRMRSCA